MKRMIVSTSTSCLDYIAKPDNVITLPMNIHFGGKNYLDGKDLSSHQLVQLVLDHPYAELSTSAPDEGRLLEFFYDLIEQGIEEVLVVTLSSYLSLTYQNIREIRHMFGDRLTIHLFDSRSVSHGEALLVYEASKMLEDEDMDIARIIMCLNQIREKMNIFITVDNLDAMIRTKRLSASAGFFANMFGIKPIVQFDDNGQVTACDKVRSFERGLDYLAHHMTQKIQNKKGRMYLMANDHNPYITALSEIVAQMGYPNAPHVPLASVALANIGINAIGLVFMED